ncbi:MAG: bactofilin family protein [Wenzhouxiangella sp.]
MGIISKGHSPDRQRSGTTVIAAGTKLVGDLALSDGLHIDGRLEGKVRSEGEVSIGQQGLVNGEISAEKILVSGQFEGSINAERLEIATGGRVDGDVTVGELVIESGARFNGTSHSRQQEPPRRIGHSKDSSSDDRTAGAETRGTEGKEKAAKSA